MVQGDGLGKLNENRKVVLLWDGHYSGQKVVIVKNFDDITSSHKYSAKVIFKEKYKQRQPPALRAGVCTPRKARHGCYRGFQASLLSQQVASNLLQQYGSLEVPQTAMTCFARGANTCP
uniref:Uncharacterized protein n=1 Tax=Salvator merianae TaxID=96440 RepID=A0A8D0DKY5_SALMN